MRSTFRSHLLFAGCVFAVLAFVSAVGIGTGRLGPKGESERDRLVAVERAELLVSIDRVAAATLRLQLISIADGELARDAVVDLESELALLKSCLVEMSEHYGPYEHETELYELVRPIEEELSAGSVSLSRFEARSIAAWIDGAVGSVDLRAFVGR